MSEDIKNMIEKVASILSIEKQPEVSHLYPFVFKHENVDVANVEKYMQQPSRMRKHITFTNVSSFLKYYNEYKKHTSPKILSMRNDSGYHFRAIMDFDFNTENDLEPQWGENIAELSLQFHEDYQSFRKISGSWFTQREFALFIEAHLNVFVNPVGADMLEMVQALKGTRNASWVQGKRLSNGETSLQYIETVDAKSVNGQITVPEYITVSMPIYEGFAPEEIKLALSYDVDEERNLKFSLRLLSKLNERQAQFEVYEEIAKETENAVFDVKSFDIIKG